MSTTVSRLAAGTPLGGRYLLDDLIAIGGMGEVWRARDTKLDRDVAVKLLKDDHLQDTAFVDMFEREAKHAAAVCHPGVAGVYDVGEHDGAPFLVMELVRGEPLSTLVQREGPLAEERIVDIVAQTADALQAAHTMGVVHRDIKPGNLLVAEDGTVKVTDFGIARATAASEGPPGGALAPFTVPLRTMGTAQYMSPEQAQGQPAAPASDVYSLGVVAYELMAGHRPFDGPSPVVVATAHVTKEPPPLPSTVHPDLRAIVMSALAKRPADRPADAAEFARRLRSVDLNSAPTLVMGTAADPASQGPATQVMAVVAPVDATVSFIQPMDEPASRVGGRAFLWLTLAMLGILGLVGMVAATRGSGQSPLASAETTTTWQLYVDIDSAALVGLPAAEATTRLEDEGMVVVLEEVPGAGALVGTVVGVTPTGRVERGAPVTLQIAENATTTDNGKGGGKRPKK